MYKDDSVLDNDPLADNPGYTNSNSGGGDIYNATANKVLIGTVYADSIANQDGGDCVTINAGAGNDIITNSNGGHVLGRVGKLTNE